MVKPLTQSRTEQIKLLLVILGSIDLKIKAGAVLINWINVLLSFPLDLDAIITGKVKMCLWEVC